MNHRFSKDVQEVIAGGLILFAIVTLAFAPFAYGDRTLMSSAAEAPSLYAAGGLVDAPVRPITLKLLDPGAAAWQIEPELFLEHDETTNERVFPLWNPYVGFGQPLAANMQSQPFYPLAWFVIALRSVRAYNWFIILRFFVAAFFTFLFLRLFVRFVAALAGGIAFAFTGYFLLYYNITHLSVECLIPALFWAMELLARRRNAASVVRLALVITVVNFGGMPESALLAFVFVYCYFVIRIVTDPKQRPLWADSGLKLVAATTLGLGMSACLLLPFAEYMKLSANQHEQRLTRSLIGLGSDPFSFQDVASYLAPLIYGPPYSDIFLGFSGWTAIRGFFGVAQVYLAIIAATGAALQFWSRRSFGWSPGPYLVVVAVVLVLKRFGSPIVNWIGALPGLSLIVFPKYEEAILGFCVACLAALGIECMASGRIQSIQAWLVTALMLATLTAIAGGEKAQFLALTEHQSFYLGSLAFGLVVLSAIAGLTWAASSTRSQRFHSRFAACAFVLIFVESLGCYFVPMWYIINGEVPLTRDPVNGAPYVTFLQRQLAVSHNRFYGEDLLLYPCWPSVFGISDVRDLDALYDFRYLAFLRAFLPADEQGELNDRFTGGIPMDFRDPLEQRFLQLSSVGYVGSMHPLYGDWFKVAFRSRNLLIYRYRNALPRLSVYTNVVRATSDAEALHLLTTGTFDPFREAVVAEGPGESLGLPTSPAAYTSRAEGGRIYRYASQDVVGSVDARTRSLVVLNDTAFPGWVATIDGHETRVITANYMFRGVVVPTGHHTVEFQYRPRSFEIGLSITIVSIFVGGCYIVLGSAGREAASRRLRESGQASEGSVGPSEGRFSNS